MAEREQRRSDSPRHERNRGWAEWLAREHESRLRAVARQRGTAEQEIDDVIQSALAGVMRSFPGPDEEKAVFSYAARAVENAAFNAHRRQGRKENRNVAIGDERVEADEGGELARALSDPSQSDPLEQLIASEAASELRERLDRLPDEQRAALVLSAAGYGLVEIAGALGLSVRATRKRIEKGNRALAHGKR